MCDNPLHPAKWIQPQADYADVCPVFKRTFPARKDVKKASLMITALGVYEACLNGQRVGDFILAPGWTVYRERLQYQTYDVTTQIREENELQVTVGRGWYAGRILAGNGLFTPKQDTALLCILRIDYADGSAQVVASDENFLSAKSPILFSELYDGETYDANVIPGSWEPVAVVSKPYDILVPQESEFVKEIEEIAPVRLLISPKGERIVDFGQNMAGYVRFSITAKAGDVIRYTHAEILDKDGNFYTANLRTAKQAIQYICRDGYQTYQPHFTFQGFQYIRLDEFPEEVDLENFRAVVIHTDMKRTGYFECSNPKLNRLFHNIIYGQKSNFVDIPTDCPQRDERLGWTGDAQIFVRTASYNFNVERFFTKWLRDLKAEQREDGGVPHTVPAAIGVADTSAGWGDSAVICPWQIYLTYGNKEILQEQFDSMKAWVDYIRRQGDNPYLWDNDHNHFGDWLGLDAPEGSYLGSTDTKLIASAYYAYSTSLLIKAGEVLGKDMAEYRALYENIVKAYQQKFIVNGALVPNTQTANAITLYFDLCENKAEIARNLATLVRENGNKLTTGFIGTPYLLHALAQNGYADVAYTLLLNEGYPSWLYSVNLGASTIWEHWDGIRQDGSFWSADMNSFNHYSYGAVAAFMYEVMAGIHVDENAPGFQHILFQPIPDKRIDYVKASIDTKHGPVKSGWTRENDQISYIFEVPSGCTATARIGDQEFSLGEGSHTMSFPA